MKFKKTSLLALTAALALVLCVTAVFATTAWKEPPAELDASSVSSALQSLEDSIQFENGTFHFTIPSSESGGNRWNIWISGRVLTAADEESGMMMSVHYLESESEKGEWVSGKTYALETADAAYDELLMTAAFGGEEREIDLSPYLPDNRKPLEVPELPEFKADIPENAAMVWPVDSAEISSYYGTRANSGGDTVTVHNGIDIAGLDNGAPIYAAASGVVKAAGFDQQGGNYVILDHGNGLNTHYCACQEILVQEGDSVELGQTIATVGQSGASTGPHLHFGVRVNGQARDPLFYFDTASFNNQSAEPAPFYAMDDGTVLYAYKTSAGYSLRVVYGGIAYAYDCESVSVQAGAEVKKGDLLGTAHGTIEPEKLDVPDTTDWKLSTLAAEYLVDGDYPRNKNGQTYAPNEYLTALLGYPPELVSGIATNGLRGYISLKELDSKTHVLMGLYKRYTDLDAAENRSIPVYDEAGDVIGEFIVEAPSK